MLSLDDEWLDISFTFVDTIVDSKGLQQSLNLNAMCEQK